MKYEIFEKWYKFLAPDVLKVKLSFYQVVFCRIKDEVGQKNRPNKGRFFCPTSSFILQS
ncbi:hypothetical protein SKUN_001392 [Spiroplasma kunkelii CR2-3x]|uniref:Uncharacterized protein n=1 Tax=Spiroplasma kunkelii CR2-3x TaxID=273035 RepID=A0A0K2JI55_SPIKU|nr:hypothetical protein SKUN_001392 [Spiroplasma kunkelii CR2-3x]